MYMQVEYTAIHPTFSVTIAETENKTQCDSIFRFWHLITVYSDVSSRNPRDERPAGLYRVIIPHYPRILGPPVLHT